MTTYNLYKYRDTGLCFVVLDEGGNFNSENLNGLRERVQKDEIEFVEVFDSKDALDTYIKDNHIELWNESHEYGIK